jgi:hypothetical protein
MNEEERCHREDNCKGRKRNLEEGQMNEKKESG